MPRTVAKVVGMRAEVITERGTTSHLHINPGESVFRVDGGYRITAIDDRSGKEYICAEYKEIA
jgi:hypothetical protein